MNLEELRSVRNTERQKDSLQELRPSFYQEVGEYIGNLEDERDRVAEQHDDPFASPEVARLTDEIETAKDVVEAVYERRMGKLVKQASLAAAGMSADSDGLTDEEESLFSDLVSRIEANKTEILSVLDGRERTDPDDDGPVRSPTDPRTDTAAPSDSETAARRDPPPVPPAEEPSSQTDRPDAARDDEGGPSVADAMGSDSMDAPTRTSDASTRASDPAADDDADGPNAPDTEGRDEPTEDEAEADHDEDVDRVTVQITADVGSILGVDDREYTLASDDVVTLPEANADPLIERDAAEPLE